jgi:hypothetical protein
MHKEVVMTVSLGSICTVRGLPGRWVVEEFRPYERDRSTDLPYLLRTLDTVMLETQARNWPESSVATMYRRFLWTTVAPEKIAVIARKKKLRRRKA